MLKRKNAEGKTTKAILSFAYVKKELLCKMHPPS